MNLIARKSVRWRLTFWNTLTFASLLVLLGVGFRIVAAQYLLSALDRDISAQSRRLQGRAVGQLMVTSETQDSRVTVNLADTGDLPLPKLPGPGKNVRVQVFRNVGMLLGDKSGQYQYRSFNLSGAPMPTPQLPQAVKFGFAAGAGQTNPDVQQYSPWDRAAFQQAATDHVLFTNVEENGAPLRVMSLPLREEERIIGVAQIAAALAPVYRDIGGLTRTLVLSLMPALVVAALAGVFLTGRALKPVKELTKAANKIRPDQLEQRLPISGADEFDELAATFNRALCRVELAFRERERMVDQLARFTADASHELRTPLTTIKANTGVALADETPTQEHIYALRQIERAANRMTSLVDDLLLLARSDAEEFAEPAALVPLNTALREAVEMLPELSGSAPIEITCSQSLAVQGNAGQLVRLFRNPLENARRYTAQEGAIRVTAEQAGDSVVVSIVDTGVGIAAEHLVHVGERFYRADAGRNRQHGGAGLGLAICRSIVARHNGRMTISSTLGAGTTVTIVLPDSSQDFVISA